MVDAAPGIFIWGALSQGVLGTSPQWDPGAKPGRLIGGVGDCPPEAEAVCRHCLHILTGETIKI